MKEIMCSQFFKQKFMIKLINKEHSHFVFELDLSQTQKT